MDSKDTNAASGQRGEAAACGPSPGSGCSAPIRFYWKQVYEIGGELHWALCDTDTDNRRPGCVSSCYTVLDAQYHLGVDGRPVDQQEILVLIAKLLTEHYSKQNPTLHRGEHSERK